MHSPRAECQPAKVRPEVRGSDGRDRDGSWAPEDPTRSPPVYPPCDAFPSPSCRLSNLRRHVLGGSFSTFLTDGVREVSAWGHHTSRVDRPTSPCQWERGLFCVEPVYGSPSLCPLPVRVQYHPSPPVGCTWVPPLTYSIRTRLPPVSPKLPVTPSHTPQVDEY